VCHERRRCLLIVAASALLGTPSHRRARIFHDRNTLGISVLGIRLCCSELSFQTLLLLLLFSSDRLSRNRGRRYRARRWICAGIATLLLTLTRLSVTLHGVIVRDLHGRLRQDTRDGRKALLGRLLAARRCRRPIVGLLGEDGGHQAPLPHDAAHHVTVLLQPPDARDALVDGVRLVQRLQRKAGILTAVLQFVGGVPAGLLELRVESVMRSIRCGRMQNIDSTESHALCRFAFSLWTVRQDHEASLLLACG